MPLIHPFTHTFTHQRRLAAMQGTNQLVRSNWGLGVLLRDTSTCPGWDWTGNPPTARRQLHVFNAILSVLNELWINSNNCCGQCYDNASNMSGLYIQSRIRKINPQAKWVQWTAAFKQIRFFFNLCSKCMYVSWGQIVTPGLALIANKTILTLNSLSDTRWCPHAQATSELCLNYGNIHDSLLSIAEDVDQKMTTCNKALALCGQMEWLETEPNWLWSYDSFLTKVVIRYYFVIRLAIFEKMYTYT